MADLPEGVQRWTFGGRHYGVTLASTPTSMDLELEDLGPGVGRGLVALVSCSDESQEMTIRLFGDEPLLTGLVEQLLSDARRELPGRA